MGEIEHAGTAKAMPAISDAETAIRTSEQGAVVGEIAVDPTTRTNTAPGDIVANDRGILPIPRPT